jgi:hypothetical protein
MGMKTIEQISFIINVTFFPIVCIVYTILGLKLIGSKVDPLAIAILALYFIVFLTKFLGAFIAGMDVPYVSFMISVACSVLIWVVLFIFIFEMHRVRLLLTSDNPSQYRRLARRNKIIKWASSIIILLSECISILTMIGQH